MSDSDSLPFRNKTISELVTQLNSLGDDHVAIHPTTLIAIHQTDSKYIRRFRSRSIGKYSSVEQSPQASRQAQDRKLQFFLTDSSQKKYYYEDIAQQLETVNIGKIMSKFEQGFNTSIVIESQGDRYKEIIHKIAPWFEQGVSKGSNCLAYMVQFEKKEARDILHGKNLSYEEAIRKGHSFYEIAIGSLMNIKSLNDESIKVLKLAKINGSNQLRIILLPSKLLSEHVDDPTLKLVKNQIFQLLNYIKTNPTKRYENINKMLPKRFPIVALLAEMLLSDSANYIINWVLDNKSNKFVVNGRFEFYDKLSAINNFIKKKFTHIEPQRIVRAQKGTSKNKSPAVSSKNLNTMETDMKKSMGDAAVSKKNEGLEPKSMKQLEYCRSFERKTHKYSISEFEQNSQNEFIHEKFDSDAQLFPQTVQFNFEKQINKSANYTETEAIVMLKAQHAREVSLYHETIQNLNRKILTLTSDQGLQEIFTIHQREIMHLELKIEELRKDICKICTVSDKKDQNKQLKAMVKKLNDEIVGLQKSAPGQKVMKGKIKLLQKQAEEWKNKYLKGQSVRQDLSHQIKALTNRLKIQEKLDEEQQLRKYQEQANEFDLSPKQQSEYKQLQSLISSKMKSQDIEKYLLRKCRNILGDLSNTREIVLDCNGFLVELQQLLETRLGSKQPNIVLDCNRFIRTYLLENLDIF